MLPTGHRPAAHRPPACCPPASSTGLLLLLLAWPGIFAAEPLGGPSIFDDFAESVSAAPVQGQAVALVKDTHSGKLAADEHGLALLRSPALANKALRIIGVVGQARTGKSFFMNSLVGKPSTFEVSSGDEGFTKGLWLHLLDAGGALPASRHDPLGAGEGGSDAPAEVATILIDSEGLGAPGGSKVYDTKMVALTAMLSSVVFYNNMRKVNKMDVEFLGDVVLFDEIFRSMTQEPLLASEIVWLVQSYSSNDACADYPARFLRKLAAGTQDDDLLMHDRVIDYVLTRSREERIFCLPYPKTEPYTPEAELYALGYHELDHGYTAQIDTVRQFVAGVPPKAGLQAESMTGAELAEVIERIVPALNDIETAAKALVSMRAEAARSNSTRLASTELDAALQLLDDCSKAPSSLSHFTQDSQRVVDDALALFDVSVIGNRSMIENSRERSRLQDSLQLMLEANSARMQAKWNACRPDNVFIVFRDYYLMVYVLQADVVVHAVVAHKFRSPALSSILLMVLSWPREVAIASGLLRMLPWPVLCDYVVEATSSAVEISPASCEHAVSSGAQGLRRLVETLVLTNAPGVIVVAIMAVAVRFGPMHLVSKLLPAMLLSIALIALSPMSPVFAEEAEGQWGGSGIYRVVVALMLVYTLVDLARNSIARVTHPGSATTARKSEYNVQLQAPDFFAESSPGADGNDAADLRTHGMEGAGQEQSTLMHEWLDQRAASPAEVDNDEGTCVSTARRSNTDSDARRRASRIGRGGGWGDETDRKGVDGAEARSSHISPAGHGAGLLLEGCKQGDVWLWITSASLPNFLDHNSHLLHAILFTGRQQLPPLLSQAAEVFAGRVVFACMLTTESEVMSRYHVSSSLVPRLIVVPTNSTEESVEHYKGRVQLLELCDFIAQQLHRFAPTIPLPDGRAQPYAPRSGPPGFTTAAAAAAAAQKEEASSQVVEVSTGLEPGGCNEALQQLRGNPLPVVVMLLAHDQSTPRAWHTLAAVYAKVLTLAVVPAHQLAPAERRALLGRDVIAGSLERPVVVALERSGLGRGEMLRFSEDIKCGSALAVWLAFVARVLASADASASEASTLPSLSPPEAESPFAETVSEKGTMSADVLSWIPESSSQVPRGCEPWVEKRQKVRSKTPPEQDNDSINAADTVGEGGRGDTQAERRQLRGLRRNLSEPLS